MANSTTVAGSGTVPERNVVHKPITPPALRTGEEAEIGRGRIGEGRRGQAAVVGRGARRRRWKSNRWRCSRYTPRCNTRPCRTCHRQMRPYCWPCRCKWSCHCRKHVQAAVMGQHQPCEPSCERSSGSIGVRVRRTPGSRRGQVVVRAVCQTASDVGLDVQLRRLDVASSRIDGNARAVVQADALTSLAESVSASWAGSASTVTVPRRCC